MNYPLTILVTLALATAGAGAASRPQRDSGKVPDDWRAALPDPVLGAHPEWVDFYYDTWRIADLKKAEHGGHTMFDTSFKPGKIWITR